MYHSVLAKQENYANSVAFYSTLVSCLAVGLCMLLLTKSYVVAMIFLLFAIITIVTKVAHVYFSKIGNFSKYIYLFIFAIAPATIMYMLESLGLFGVTSIAFSFAYLFVAIMYYNWKIVGSYSAITFLVYIFAILVFPAEFYNGPGKNLVSWISFGVAFSICMFVSILQSKRSRRLILTMESKEKESEALTLLLNRSINEASSSSEGIYDVAKELSDGINEANKTA